MKPIVIVIRGNSGSGKTTLANQLQAFFGNDNCLLLHQDVIRREILHANDRPGTPAVGMIKTLLEYGSKEFPVTILEGILRRDVYGKMLNDSVDHFGPYALVYYLDVAFATTVVNDAKKVMPFGAKVLNQWWREKDYLGSKDIILDQGGINACYCKIIKDVKAVNGILK